MDLGAYANIEELESLAAKNNIIISRVRGYRLMKDERPRSDKEIEDIGNDIALSTINNYFSEEYIGDGVVTSSYDDAYYRKRKKYAYIIDDYSISGVRWDKVHGKLRKRFKFIFKQCKKETLKQYTLWNKYAGQEDVLYIHVTLLPYITGSNELKSKPTQHSVKELQSLGIKPDILVCRSECEIDDSMKEKISLFCKSSSTTG